MVTLKNHSYTLTFQNQNWLTMIVLGHEIRKSRNHCASRTMWAVRLYTPATTLVWCGQTFIFVTLSSRWLTEGTWIIVPTRPLQHITLRQEKPLDLKEIALLSSSLMLQWVLKVNSNRLGFSISYWMHSTSKWVIDWWWKWIITVALWHLMKYLRVR